MNASRHLLLASVLLWLRPAGAYTIGTGFTPPCHERITLGAYSNYIVDLPADAVPIPSGPAWQKLSSQFLKDFHLESYTQGQQVILLSLLVGVRAPDAEGHSVADLRDYRVAQLPPELQYAHSLRSTADQGADGNAKAIAGTRAAIEALVGQAEALLTRPKAQQLIQAPVYLDYYGSFEVPVWGPAYLTGRALHALQDSFSHTLRQPSMTKISHVMTYLKAMSTDYDEARDGLRHSSEMDTCGDATSPLTTAAQEASIDLVLSVTGPLFLKMESTRSLAQVLDLWLTVEEGCDASNQYCGSPYLRLARLRPTEPLLGCAQGSGTTSSSAGFVLLLSLLLRERSRLRPLFFLSLAIAGCASRPGELERTPLDCSTRNFSACGGNLTGSWGGTATCPDVTPADHFCPGAFETTVAQVAGTFTFDAGTLDFHQYGHTTSQISFPKSCLGPQRPTCASGNFTNVPCLDLGDRCRCTFTYFNPLSDAVTTYDTDGGILVIHALKDGVDSPEAFHYCVQGDFLTLGIETGALQRFRRLGE